MFHHNKKKKMHLLLMRLLVWADYLILYPLLASSCGAKPAIYQRYEIPVPVFNSSQVHHKEPKTLTFMTQCRSL